MPKDKELADHERAHTGKPGSQADHGGPLKHFVYSHEEDKLRQTRATLGNKSKHWKYSTDLVEKHPTGVEEREFHGKFHVFGAEARDESDARQKMQPHIDAFNKERGYD